VAEWEKRCKYKAVTVATWPALFACAAEQLINVELQVSWKGGGTCR
jgi:hypothetical protein